MKTIYIDEEFKCHVENNGDFTEIETDFFDGKCDEFIEGYRFVPHGCTWIREDGVSFTGEMISPCRGYDSLLKIQAKYELDTVTAERDELLENIVQLIEEVYASDLEMME